MNVLKPKDLMQITRSSLPWLLVFCFIFFICGICLALLFSPDDYKQGEIVRIMYIHVPTAWMSLAIYMLIALLSFAFLVWNNVICSVLARAASSVGMVFAAVCLITGSIWGKGTWGTWWVWDARLTSMLILFFSYVGYLMLWNFFSDEARAMKSASVFAIFSAINVPIVKFSVNLWSTLHQPASILRAGGVAIDSSMLIPLIAMFIFFIFLFLVLWVLNSHKLIDTYKIKKEIVLRF
ncbi:heme ABC transporter permease CcmC [Candidatus Mesenet endosymbiont of Phosphuga atrata]|uniref:heme ABC transporter permease CcmC n=1 Tax=Candidatus Mesenet endosymbiont of Phosphuga atrata TaxID=3066221 RepID=UPI0030CE98E2